MKTLKIIIAVVTFTVLLIGCNSTPKSSETTEVDENGFAVLTDAQVDNMVKRAYQYVALYNVTNKFAMGQGGWNTMYADTKLKDHTLTNIARPNNDTFYTFILLDLQKGSVVVDLPKFDSKYVSLMVSTYDHYVYVPKSTRQGDFQKSEKIIFYSAGTQGYSGEVIEGIDEVFKANGDFVSVTFRVMPHANNPERFATIVEQIGQIKIQTLAEFQGNEPGIAEVVVSPQVGKTDADVFGDNLLKVMQFAFNHLSFDKNVEMDNEVLAAFKPLGIEPGKTYDTETNIKIDGKRFRETAIKIQNEQLANMVKLEVISFMLPKLFQPKGKMSLEPMLIQTVSGPLGLPMKEAMYPPVVTSDGSTMNALNDYVIKMTQEELPPAKAFWSLTLYDKANGFFIPNDFKKYSVGENAGMKLNPEGGIEIYVAAEKPEGVPDENWLPINRNDEDIDIVLRIYVPDIDKVKTWASPKANKIK